MTYQSTTSDRADGTTLGLADLAETTRRVQEAVEMVIEGKPEVVRLALTAVLAEGHLLVEDVPGVGKTMLAKALARSIDCTVRRIQFTPDLMPSDVTGVSVFDQASRQFEFKPGGVFANVVVGDEINRASPKTQSALLECMEERQVTVDGTTYELAPPFIVIATQNPVEMEGTYPLPEAQRDRFMIRLAMGYPAPAAEMDMIDTHGSAPALETVSPVTDASRVAKLVEVVRQVHVAASVKPPRKQHSKAATDTKPKDEPWTHQELLAFRAVADSHEWAAVWRLTLCGLCRSEVMGMTWDCVDLERGEVRIEHGRVLLDGHRTATDDPKSSASRRTISVEEVQPGTVALLRTL